MVTELPKPKEPEPEPEPVEEPVEEVKAPEPKAERKPSMEPPVFTEVYQDTVSSQLKISSMLVIKLLGGFAILFISKKYLDKGSSQWRLRFRPLR